METLDRYLNDAYLGGLRTVRIVHGKGTGAVRAAVREQLSGHALVSRFQPADQREGGGRLRFWKDRAQFELPDGATVTPREPPRSMNSPSAPSTSTFMPRSWHIRTIASRGVTTANGEKM